MSVTDDPELRGRVRRLLEFLRETVGAQSKPIRRYGVDARIEWLFDDARPLDVNTDVAPGDVAVRIPRTSIEQPPGLPAELEQWVDDTTTPPTVRADAPSEAHEWLQEWTTWALDDRECRPFAEVVATDVDGSVGKRTEWLAAGLPAEVRDAPKLDDPVLQRLAFRIVDDEPVTSIACDEDPVRDLLRHNSARASVDEVDRVLQSLSILDKREVAVVIDRYGLDGDVPRTHPQIAARVDVSAFRGQPDREGRIPTARHN